MTTGPGVDLYWLPLGADGHSVRLNGRIFEGVGRFRSFRYEVRRWRNGVIPDIGEAVESPQRLTDDPDLAQRVLSLATDVPTPVWGRDELGAGEMWNSNSLTSWLIARCGLAAESIHAPAGGRAPGWHAGLVAARLLVGAAPESARADSATR
jgi:hypothetical protein